MVAMGFLRVLQGQDSVRFTPVCSSKSAVLKFYKDKTLFDFVWCALCENLLALLSHKDKTLSDFSKSVVFVVSQRQNFARFSVVCFMVRVFFVL